MRRNLRLITRTTLTKQVWPTKNETVVSVMSTEAFTITRQSDRGTQVEVHTHLGVVTVELK